MKSVPHLAMALVFAWGMALGSAPPADAGEKIVLTPDMITNESGVGAPEAMVDEQGPAGQPRVSSPETKWQTPGYNKLDQYPVHFYIDLGQTRHLSRVSFYDMNGKGDIHVSTGQPGQWEPLLTDDGVGYKTWKDHDVDVKTRYVRVTKDGPGGLFHELALYEYTDAELVELAARKKVEQERQRRLEIARAEKADRPLVDAGAPFGKLPLIQEIICGQDAADGVEFVEGPGGASKVEQVFGKPVRVLPNEGGPKYFAYRMGQYKLLEPHKAYLLTVDFPEDQPRSFVIENRGGDLTRGVHTGHTAGDVLYTYTDNHIESIDVPLSGEMNTFQSLFYLNERIAGLPKQRGGAKHGRPFGPDDGFYVVISQTDSKNAPLSAGAAVSRIRLFEVPDPERFNVTLNLPEGLPHRHLFYREEMGDGVVGSRDATRRAFDQKEDWYRVRAKTMNFLGMNTFSKDLLEFGAVQDWDAGDNNWFWVSHTPQVWGNILPIMAEHGLNVLPMYEYGGAAGREGIGAKQFAEPLRGPGDYTHVKWTEKRRADLTDPRIYEDFKKVLDYTVVRHKDKADFLGIWLRPRPSQLPISFADATRQRFAEEANDGVAVSRQQLQDDESLLQRYYDWWFGKRRDFLLAMRDHLRDNGVDDAIVLMECDPSEPGAGPGASRGDRRLVVTDRSDLWEPLLQNPDHEKLELMSWDRAVEAYPDALTDWRGTWSHWEWQHAVPPADPQRYAEDDGVMMAYGFNRQFSVANPEGMERFRGPSGLAMVRHYALNEHAGHDDLGYLVVDMERTGPYSMLLEARAVAQGDPWHIGYLAGHIFQRGFPEYARRFNQNFLALPALPSVVVDGAADAPEVVVRSIETPGHGTYLAVVNTGLHDQPEVTVKLPAQGRVTDAVTGEAVASRNGAVTLSLYPGELRSLHVE